MKNKFRVQGAQHYQTALLLLLFLCFLYTRRSDFHSSSVLGSLSASYSHSTSSIRPILDKYPTPDYNSNIRNRM